MPIKVYHAWPRDARHAFSDRLADLADLADLERLDEARLVLVAHLATDDLEQAFAWTQHVDIPWDTQTNRVLALQPGPYPLVGELTSPQPRSTSVGDVFERTPTGERFLVASVGFVPLPMRPAPARRFPQRGEERHQVGPFSWDVALAWRLIAQRAQRPQGVQQPGQDAGVAPSSVAAVGATAAGASATAPAPRPDGRDPLRLISSTVMAQLATIDVLHALTDEVDPRIPLLIASAQATRVVTTLRGVEALQRRRSVAGTTNPAHAAGVAGNPGAEELLHAEATLVDGRRRLAKALIEEWPSVPYYRLSMPEVGVCCDAYAPYLTRTSSAHACGYPLVQTALTLDTSVWRWQADARTPLLWRCPQCDAALA